MNSDFDVAIHALVYLRHKAATLTSEELAKNVCTNPGRVRRVLAPLKKAGLISTREGRFGGGYTYQDIRPITLGEVARALQVKFTAAAWHSGSQEMDCRVASGMAAYMDSLYKKLDFQCIAYLDAITIADVEQALFQNSDTAESPRPQNGTTIPPTYTHGGNL